MTHRMFARAVTVTSALLLSSLVASCQPPAALSEDHEAGLREINIEHMFGESDSGDLLSGGGYSHRELLELLKRMQDEPKVLGLFLRFDSFGGGWGRAADLIDAFAGITRAKKPIHCHADGADNSSFVVMANACDRITMSPSGLLNLVGVSAQLFHARKLLDSIGVHAEMLHVGKYKGAADMLTEETITPAARETWEELLSAIDARIVAAVAKRLKTDDTAKIRAAIDRGPLAASDAKLLGLIDDIEYDDEARTHAKAAAKTDHVAKVRTTPGPEEMSLGEILSALAGGGPDSRPDEPHLSIVTLTGTIMDGEGDNNPSAAADPFIKHMRRLGDDKNVSAVLLRIDSPGGSAPASDRMWHAVARVAKRKPVVVSVGDMAASGGYYIACAATKIFAQNESLVGSIGVVGGKIVAADLAQRVGIDVTVLKRGQNSAWLSLLRRLEPSERDALQRVLTSTYEMFLQRVQAGRKMPMDKVRAMAEGRVMSGARGIEGGLVDARGGFAEALAEARKLGKLGNDAPTDVWPPRESFFERLSHAMGAERETSMRQQWLSMLPLEARVAVIESLLINGDRAATVLPYALSIR